jgi:hypothetical protein
MFWRRRNHADIAGKVNFSIQRKGLMTKNISKSREQKLTKAVNQMDAWMQHKTRLIVSISTPLFYLVLRGRVVGRQEGLFLFDSYGEVCRVPVIPEHYDRVLCNQKGPASVTFETSGMQGKLELGEDGREAGLAELCAEWALSTMGDAPSSDAAEQVTL